MNCNSSTQYNPYLARFFSSSHRSWSLLASSNHVDIIIFFSVNDLANAPIRSSRSSGWLSKKFSIAFNSSDISSASAAVFDDDFLSFFSSLSSQSDSCAMRVLNSPYSANRTCCEEEGEEGGGGEKENMCDCFSRPTSSSSSNRGALIALHHGTKILEQKLFLI